MSFMDSVNKLKEQFVDRDGDDAEYGQEERPAAAESPVSARPAAVRSAVRTAAPASARPYTMVVVNPESYKDAEKIGDHIKEGHPVVMNVEKTDQDIAERIVDFVQGVMYALDGHMDRISDTIFLCAPNNMTVAKENFSAYSAPAAPSGDAPAAVEVPRWNVPRN